MRGLWTGDSLKVGGHLARFAEVILVGHIFDPKKKRSTAGQRWEINENLKSVNFVLREAKAVVSVPNEMSDQKLDTSLKYLQISPSKLSCSEGGVQPCMRTLGGTMVLPGAPIDIPTEVLQCPLPIDTVSSFLVPSSESTLSSRDGMYPNVTRFLKGFFPFLIVPLTWISSFATGLLTLWLVAGSLSIDLGLAGCC